MPTDTSSSPLINTMIAEGRLIPLDGPEDGPRFLERAQEYLESARRLHTPAHSSSVFFLAHNAVCRAAAALLAQYGALPCPAGGYSAVVEALRPSFGDIFEKFDKMRCVFDRVENPETPEDVRVSEDTVTEALDYAAKVVTRCEKVLDSDGGR